jgi:hypothetical protein
MARPRKIETVEEEVKEPRKFAQDDKIMCKSVIEGGLFFYGDKSRETYKFSGYGDETEVEYRDLTTAINSRSPFVFAPYFIIEDEEFIAQNKALSDYYAKNPDLSNLKSVLDLPIDEMEQRINSFSDATKRAFKTIVISEIADKKVDSLGKISILSNFYGTDFTSIAE